MFDRVPMLGQVGITEQAGFGGSPWSVNTPVNPNVRFPAPYGAPAAAEENVGRWLCPDGMERVLTEAQARAMGCTRRNLVNMMGQGAGSPGGPPPGGGAPTVSVSPIVHDGGFTQPFQQQFEFFQPYWGYPQYPQYPYPQQQQRMICRKLEEASEAEGRDVFECQSQPVAPPAANYAVYTYPMRNWWY